ncbi:hypothetical protein Tco_0218239 [Tanacetum coccineum]
MSTPIPKESIGLNDIVHKHYLEEAKKKAQLQKDNALNSKPSVITFARLQNTANGRKLEPRRTNQPTRHLACHTCKKYIFTTNHDACILKYLYEVNSRAKAQSHKTTKRYNLVAQKSNAKKPERWKPTGRIFNSIGVRWTPTGKIVGTCINANDSALPLEKEICTPKTVICANSFSLLTGTSTVSEPI